MGLATAALARGDGEWENIQEVLRSAFLAHEEQLHAHAKRLDANEQRATELSAICAANSESLPRCQGLRGHVDALARMVNTLSEELKQRTQDEQDQRHQLKGWMDSITRTVETQVSSAHDRIAQVETTLDNVQRRMELVEEELGHFVDALERKADVQVVQSQKKAVEEALKLRCRKVAFDKEVQRVHDLLRKQMSTTTERLELLRCELTEELRSHQEHAVQQNQTREVGTTQQLREELMKEIECVRQNTLVACEDHVATVKARVEEALAVQGDVAAKQREDLSALKERLEQVVQEREKSQRDTEGYVQLKIRVLHDSLEPRLVQLEQSYQTHTDKIGGIDAASTKLTEELSALQIKLDGITVSQTQHAEAMSQNRRDVETRQAELAEEVRDGWRAREKKTRQQMHLVADKLREMDQILKLVGKQLVQNTSQLQLLWSEQRELDLGGEETVAPMIEDGEAVVAQFGTAETEDHDRAVDATAAKEAEDVTARRISQHEQLQESIEAKLRDYEEILLLQKQTPHQEAT